MKNFNPRTHKGYDTIDRGVNVSIYHFNPRTREGYDINQTRLSEIDTILIPVPVKGTIIRLAHFYFAYIALIPVSTKGTIKLTKKGKINYPL